MTKIFIFAHFGLNIRHFFSWFCLYNREISLAVMLRQLSKQNGKINMTKCLDKIVIFLKGIVMHFFHITQPYFQGKNKELLDLNCTK